MTVRTRFAPSPTGKLHLGNLRTALYCWLYARHHGGEFLLRIEDTDQERSTQAAIQLILDSMEWLGLDYDLGPIYQTERLARYHAAVEQLLDHNLAYRCYCSKERLAEIRTKQLLHKEKPRYDGHCRDRKLPAKKGEPYVIRFKNPLTGSVSFTDQILGNLTFKNSELDDLVIVRSDGTPTYNFCVVIDDLEMQITNVIRGADHINNTPRQINIFRAFNGDPPAYAHLPLILGQDGKLLSKRHGAASILEYRAAGYLPAALLNYLIRLGWSQGDQELFSRQEMIALFDLKDINKAAASFDPEKLLWLNRHYIKTLPPQEIAPQLIPHLKQLQLDPTNGPNVTELIVALRERADTLSHLAEKSSCFYTDEITYQENSKPYLTSATLPLLQEAYNNLTALSVWNDEMIHSTIVTIAQKFAVKLGQVAQPIRAAITGTIVSPPLNVTIRLIGKKRVLARLQQAFAYIALQ